MWVWLSPLVFAVVAAAVLGGLLVSAGLLGALLLVLLTANRPKILAPAIALVAMLFTRPNLWGEQYSHIGLVLFLLAAAIALIQDQGNLKCAHRKVKVLWAPLIWVVVAYVWLVARAAFQGLATVAQFSEGLLLTAGAVLAVLIVAADPTRRILLAKGFVGIVLLCCMSYIVTAAMWATSGLGSGVLTSIQIGAWPEPQPIYLPFTTTVSTQSVLNFQLPRFAGIGREPGWMALYGAVALLMLPLIGWHRTALKLTLLIGVCATVSTAGFGVLIVCLALNFMLSGESRGRFKGVLRLVFGLFLLALAAWIAFYAPVLGIGVKGEQNGISLSERTVATNAGLWALANAPFAGGVGADKIGAVNLVAAVAAYGVPFSIAMGFATVAPLRLHPSKRRLAPLFAAVFLTLLTSQPALDSTWIFALVTICAGLAMSRDESANRYGYGPYPGNTAGLVTCAPQENERTPFEQAAPSSPSRPGG